MATLYVDRKGLLARVDNEALVFYDEEQTRMATVPLRVLHRMCIHGDLRLSAAVLAKLGAHGIGVLILNGRKHDPVLLMPNTKVDAQRRIMQYQCSLNEQQCLSLSIDWVRCKLQHQSALLSYFGEKNASLQAMVTKPLHFLQQIQMQLDSATDKQTLMGWEGIAATHYFQALAVLLPAGLHFQKRNRRPPRDPFNAMLSLGYTLLHFEFVRLIYLVGLDPFIGFYHDLAASRESLACDLLEPYRPKYDLWLVSLFDNHTLRTEDFYKQDEACSLGKAGRLRFYTEYEQWIKSQRAELYTSCLALLKRLRELSGVPNSEDTDESWLEIDNDTLADCL